MIRRKIGDVVLLPSEEPIKAWYTQTATWGPLFSGGTLNLTSDRLIWIREGFNFVPGSNVVIGLEDIDKCWSGAVDRHVCRLRLRDASKRTFRVLAGVSGSDVADAITDARRKRGLLDD